MTSVFSVCLARNPHDWKWNGEQTLQIAPPLTIDRESLQEAVEVIGES